MAAAPAADPRVPETCTPCGGPLWRDGAEVLEPISGLMVGWLICVRCGTQYVYARGRRRAVAEEEDD